MYEKKNLPYFSIANDEKQQLFENGHLQMQFGKISMKYTPKLELMLDIIEK